MLHRCLFLAAIVVTTSATAQHVSRSAGFDLGALSVSEVRLNIEPLTAGRWTLAVGLARWSDDVRIYQEFVRTAQEGSFQSGLESVPGNTQLALDATVRTYPRALESTVPERRFRAYIGLGAGLTQRTAADPIRPQCPAGSLCVQPTAVVAARRSLGVDALTEIGVRFEPASSFLLDIGARGRLVGALDPTGRFARGDFVPNAVVAVGFGW